MGNVQHPFMPFDSSQSMILIPCVIVMVRLGRSRMISIPNTLPISPISPSVQPLYRARIVSHSGFMTSTVVNMSRLSTQMNMMHLPYLRTYRAGSLRHLTESTSRNSSASTLCHSRAACFRPYNAFFSLHTLPLPSPSSSGWRTNTASVNLPF